MSVISLAGSRLDELRASGNLPSPKGVALEILRLSRSENASGADIVRVLQADPALAGRILRAANSASLGARRPVVSLNDAVMLLGMPLVRQLALGFSLVTQYRGGACKAFDYQGFWRRSLLCALSAQLIAVRMKVIAPEELFACGLLSQVGKLALASVFPAEYDRVLSRLAAAPQGDLRALEQHSFATDHLEVTVSMLADWGLPTILRNAVGAHMEPEKFQAEDGSRLLVLTRALHFAAALSDVTLGEHKGRAERAPGVLRKALRLGLDADAVDQFSTALGKQWGDWAPLLELPPMDIVPLKDMIEPAATADPVQPGATEFPLRILIVDADPVALAGLQQLLASAGHTVATAGDGRHGLEVAVKFQPQLLVTGWEMPGMDGVELCRTLRASQIGQSMHMLIVTAFEDEEHLVAAFNAGIDDYMVKPLRPRTLAARLRSAQRMLRLQDERERQALEMRSLASELAVNNRRLQQAAVTDFLTGLPNRRYAFDRLDQEWAASRRRISALSCIVIDVDHFKAVNDTHGHDAGDALLRNVARLLRESARLPDAVCRIGGEEFVVICPDTALADAFRVAERLRAAVNGNSLSWNGVKLSCTISLGVAAVDTSIASPAELIRKADQAAYQAKKEGRNVTRLFRVG